MKRFLYFIAIGIALIACTPNADLGTPFYKGQEVTLSAAIGTQHPQLLPSMQRVSGLDKTPSDPNGTISLTWDKGDKILVIVDGKTAEFTLTSGEGTENASFRGIMPTDGTTFHVQYPIDYNASVLHVQKYVPNGFDKGLMKMRTIAEATIDQGFTLSAEHAVLGLQFSGDAKVSKIEVTNIAAKQMYTLDCSSQPVATAHGSTLFYIVVPAGKWSDGMKVEVYNATGVVIESRTKASEIEFSAANALMMAPLQLQDINYKVIDGLFNMVFVEGGTFMMGKGKDAHQVTLSDYYMSECELTQAQWEAVMGEIPQNGFYRIEKYGDNYPMSGISLLECQEFVDKLNAMTGLHFRIPTEAEWEYAARGGKKSKGYIYAGSNDINEVAIYDGTVRRDENGAVIYAPAPVMTRKPNELGIYDMSGNLCEWVTDWNGAFNLYPQLNPTGTAAYSDKSNPFIIRGGCWTYAATDCQSTSRKPFPNHGANGIGLRLVLSDEEPFKMVYVDDTTRIVLRPVKGGTFWMGSNASDAESDEKPVHEVMLSDFYIGETEVTQQLWQLVMGTNPSSHKGAILPVERITWDECQVFVEKLSDMTGLPFRLPTEAEWEYAARGGQMSQGYTYAGSNAIDNVAWYHKNCTSPQPVGLKAPNELGIYDMSGNVWEKCSDWYGPYTEEKQTNPKGPNSSSNNCRVTRGGSWKDQEEYTWQICCRTVNRGYQTISDRSDFKGLRIVMGTKHTGN
jgi:formylglycine-generating enzyme required for sulfatase activity